MNFRNIILVVCTTNKPPEVLISKPTANFSNYNFLKYYVSMESSRKLNHGNNNNALAHLLELHGKVGVEMCGVFKICI